MEEVVKLLSDFGISIACVGYLIYFQSTTMKEMLSTLNGINTRLSVIEDRLSADREN